MKLNSNKLSAWLRLGRTVEKSNCLECGKSIDEGHSAKLGLCQDCFKELVRVFNEKKMQNIMRLCENRQPVVEILENGKPYFAFYLPLMMKCVEVKSEKPNTKKYSVSVDLGEKGPKIKGDLVGLAGFYYSAEYYWGETPENVIKAWNWFNQMTQANEDYWVAVEYDTVRDFLDNNWKPSNNEFRDSLTPYVLSLILDLYALDRMKVDVGRKISEIRKQMKGQIENYEKLSEKIEFSTDFKLSRNALLRVTNLRKYLAHLSSESRLARLAKSYGFDVTLDISPDLTINGKKIDVKKPDERYIIPEKREFLTFVSDASTVIENLSNHISEGFGQKVDIVAIEVHHLDKRPIKGFHSKWLGPSTILKNALLNAINHEKKGTVLLFMRNSKGYFGRVLRCRRIQQE